LVLKLLIYILVLWSACLWSAVSGPYYLAYDFGVWEKDKNEEYAKHDFRVFYAGKMDKSHINYSLDPFKRVSGMNEVDYYFRENTVLALKLFESQAKLVESVYREIGLYNDASAAAIERLKKGEYFSIAITDYRDPFNVLALLVIDFDNGEGLTSIKRLEKLGLIPPQERPSFTKEKFKGRFISKDLPFSESGFNVTQYLRTRDTVYGDHVEFKMFVRKPKAPAWIISFFPRLYFYLDLLQLGTRKVPEELIATLNQETSDIEKLHAALGWMQFEPELKEQFQNAVDELLKPTYSRVNKISIESVDPLTFHFYKRKMGTKTVATGYDPEFKRNFSLLTTTPWDLFATSANDETSRLERFLWEPEKLGVVMTPSDTSRLWSCQDLFVVGSSAFGARNFIDLKF
jgi:hypothetical protein